jgi:hypothetical protein
LLEARFRQALEQRGVAANARLHVFAGGQIAAPYQLARAFWQREPNQAGFLGGIDDYYLATASAAAVQLVDEPRVV